MILNALKSIAKTIKQDVSFKLIKTDKCTSFYGVDGLDQYRLFCSLWGTSVFIGFEELTKEGYLVPSYVSYRNLNTIFTNLKEIMESIEDTMHIETISIQPHTTQTRREYIRFLSGCSFLSKDTIHKGILSNGDLLVSSKVLKEGDMFQMNCRGGINNNKLKRVTTLCF